MPGCTFFQIDRQAIKSHEINPPAGVPRERIVPVRYCIHRHSPVTLAQTRVMGGANLLLCQGDLEKCPLSRAQYLEAEGTR